MELEDCVGSAFGVVQRQEVSAIDGDHVYTEAGRKRPAYGLKREIFVLCAPDDPDGQADLAEPCGSALSLRRVEAARGVDQPFPSLIPGVGREQGTDRSQAPREERL